MTRTDELIEEYAGAVQIHGPDSVEARRIREENDADAEFAVLADALYRIRKKIPGRRPAAVQEGVCNAPDPGSPRTLERSTATSQARVATG